MKHFVHPIIGQEAVVGRYGLGRVVSFSDSGEQYIEVQPYIAGYPMKFSPDNVQLVPLSFQPVQRAT